MFRRKQESIDQIVEAKLKNHLARIEHSSRPASWEDDICKNAKDATDFENGNPISEYCSDEVRRKANQFDHRLFRSVDLKNMTRRDTFPIPSSADREGYLPGHDISFWISGLSDYLKVANTVHDQGVDVNSVLDFGCASGRVVRHFCIQSEFPEIWGSEINYRHVRWLSQFMPANLKPIHTPVIPGLPIAAGSIDLICAFSVFTHIDTFESAWIAELHRLMRPGGLCYFTVHNNDTWRELKEMGPENGLYKRLLACQNFDRNLVNQEIPADRMVFRFTDRGPYRSQVFHSNDYLKKTWGRFFDFQEILPNQHGKQAVVIMRKASKAVSKSFAA